MSGDVLQETVAMLNADICDRARLARDARFDGRFVTGVRTTRIYCRPICPVKPAKSSNVCFFPGAAAAERSGFRPCLRCRPEKAPDSPISQGSNSIVSRGLALIDSGFLDGHSIEEAADSLGIGARHLTRLFTQHLGAPPSALARTRRVQTAKKLIDESDMSITEIAFAAGFSSIRRFNAEFKDTYGRQPSHFKRPTRRLGSNKRALTLNLSYRPPFNWPSLVALLGAEATPGVEAVSASEYCRTIAVDEAAGWFSVRPVIGRNLLRLTLHLPDYTRLKQVIERVHTLFDLRANPEQVRRDLGRHPRLASVACHMEGLRLPGAWDGFEVAVRSLVARDVGHIRTTEVMGELVKRYGLRLCLSGDKRLRVLFPAPDTLLQASLDDLGISRLGTDRIQRLARSVAHGQIKFDSTVAFDELVNRLTQEADLDVPSAHWVAMRTLGEPDASPFGAHTISAAAAQQWLDASALEALRPWRSYAAVLLALRLT